MNDGAAGYLLVDVGRAFDMMCMWQTLVMVSSDDTMPVTRISWIIHKITLLPVRNKWMAFFVDRGEDVVERLYGEACRKFADC